MKDIRLQEILELIIEDRKNGFNHPWKDYLIHLEPFSDKDHRNRELNRIHKTVSENRSLIDEAERYFILLQAGKAPVVENIPVVEEDEIKDSVSINDFISYAKEGKRITDILDNFKYEMNLTFQEGDIILPLGDFHIGSAGVDYDMLMEYVEIIINNPCVKAVLLGDFTENHLEFQKNLDAVLSMVLSPKMQLRFSSTLLEALKESIILAVSGNHDEHGKGHGVENSMERACKDVGISFHEGFAKLNITYKDTVYSILCNHRPLGKSINNPLHGCMKMQGIDPTCHAYIAAHIHRPALCEWWQGSIKKVAIVTGTLNVDAKYSKIAYDPTGAKPDYPCLLFIKGKMLAFWNIKDALEHRSIVSDNESC